MNGVSIAGDDDGDDDDDDVVATKICATAAFYSYSANQRVCQKRDPPVVQLRLPDRLGAGSQG